MLSRRVFLASLGCAVLAFRLPRLAERVPILLDHIILGCSDLDSGIAFLERGTGVRAAAGGSHPGGGTRNALLSLGGRRYLEILAPDPEQVNLKPQIQRGVEALKALPAPRLMTWAEHPGDLVAFAAKLRRSGFSFAGPLPGSRVRPDGRVLKWKTIVLRDSRHGLLPFFIEWGTGSVHPSQDAPSGCRVENFVVADPDSGRLSTIFERLGVAVQVERAPKPQLRARIVGPRGTIELTS